MYTVAFSASGATIGAPRLCLPVPLPSVHAGPHARYAGKVRTVCQAHGKAACSRSLVHNCPVCGSCLALHCSSSASASGRGNSCRRTKWGQVKCAVAEVHTSELPAEQTLHGRHDTAIALDNADAEGGIQKKGSGTNTVTSSSNQSVSVYQGKDKVFLYPPAESDQIRNSWDTLMRWSKLFGTKKESEYDPLDHTNKIVVFGGGSFGTAMGVALATKKSDLDVVLLLRDPLLCQDINTINCNTRYLKEFTLPGNVRATTNASEAIAAAKFAVHAVPVQHSRAFLHGVKDILPANVPVLCVSKGLEAGSGMMMSEVIPSALERKQPAVFLSGPSFAKEVMEGRPTGLVAASKDQYLARSVQSLFASPSMRVNMTTDVVGVEICGALKNVLAIAAGIVEGLDLGHNALAALIAQGCAEIRWLAERMGAKSTTTSGLSGLGDIMLTCYGSLSRNRTVGIRLGRGEKLEDILASSSQVAEGVATAGVVVVLARKYRVSLPVLTAVAQVLDNNLSPAEAVYHIMCLPQIEER